MLSGLIGDRELTKIVANHFGLKEKLIVWKYAVLLYLNFNLVKSFTIVNTDHRTNHFRNNDHIAKMGLNNSWLFICSTLKLGLAKTFD